MNEIETEAVIETRTETAIGTKIGSGTVTTVNGTGNGGGIEKTATVNGSAAAVKGRTAPTAPDPATLALAPAHRTGTARVLFPVPLRTVPFVAATARPLRNMLGSVTAGI